MRYKVGDKVRIKSINWYNENMDEDGYVNLRETNFHPEMFEFCGQVVTIDAVRDNFYDIKDDCGSWYWTDEMFEGLAEEETTKMENEIRINGKEVMGILASDVKLPTGSTTIWDLPEGYEFRDENDNVINATKIVLEKKKPKYPQSYEGCSDVLGTYADYDMEGYKYELLWSLQKLLICRDAYWKIAGDEMGLGKPWEPDYENYYGKWYNIYTVRGKIEADDCRTVHSNKILAFPNKEMRDAFYEAFKELINEVKELL